jgi:predicted metal-binding membrane protein
VVASLAVITAIGWFVAVQLAAGMTMPVGSMDMAAAMPPVGPQFVLVAAMWAAMMVGMMVPSATPMVVAYADWTRRGPISVSRTAAVASFLSGYVLVWLGFSLLAAVLQSASNASGCSRRPVRSAVRPSAGPCSCSPACSRSPRGRSPACGAAAHRSGS